MAKIHDDVESTYFQRYPETRSYINLILRDVDITWARKIRKYNTTLEVFLAKPETFFSETFDIGKEIMIVYSKYSKTDSRVLKSANEVLSEEPFSERADSLIWILISEDEKIEQFVREEASEMATSKVVIPIFIEDLKNSPSDSWFLRNKLAERLYIRDFFSDSLPILSDEFFFGRTVHYSEMMQNIKRGENIGLFGLRKTGKTSLLFKIIRGMKSESIAEPLYYDCKKPFIRGMHSWELLEEIGTQIEKEILKIDSGVQWSERNASRNFYNIVGELNRNSIKVCLIFDEIEYISFLSPLDNHWEREFIDFWQTLWSSQSEYKSLSFVIAGVNPSISEKDTIIRVQNPLFGILKTKYLTGFSLDELNNLTKKFGKRMGVKFDPQVIKEMHSNYGGHPLISRQIFSGLNSRLSAHRSKPMNIKLSDYKDNREDLERDIIYYCQHVISELEQFYPDEYEMLEMLSTDQIADFTELANDPTLVNHLINYGLVRNESGKWTKSMPIIFDHIKGKKGIYIVPTEDRDSWIFQRRNAIISEMRNLERLILRTATSPLFGANSFPEAERIGGMSVVCDYPTFENFVNALNRSFVESIENYGVSIGKNKYFWNEIKSEYPHLWLSLHDIKTYRHDCDHLKLNNSVSENLDGLLERHLGKKHGKRGNIDYFLLQQRVLDELLVGVRSEISSRS